MRILKWFRMFNKKKKCKVRTGKLIATELKEKYKKEAREATNALLQAFDEKQVA